VSGDTKERGQNERKTGKTKEVKQTKVVLFLKVIGVEQS